MSSAIGSAASTITQSGNESGNGFSALSSQDFLKIILSELTNQDPLEPNDTGAILEQLSSLRNIESQTTLDKNMSALVTQNALASSSNMIGKYVEGINDANSTIRGLVSSLTIQEGRPILRMQDGSLLPAERVLEVYNVDDAGSSALPGLLGGMDPNSLLGMLIAGVDAAGQPVSGVATGIRIEQGSAFFELDTGHRMPFAGLNNVRSVNETQAQTQGQTENQYVAFNAAGERIGIAR